MVGTWKQSVPTTVHFCEEGCEAGASGATGTPRPSEWYSWGPSQMQHMLREGEQDLCHLQGREETAALPPAGHRVVRGTSQCHGLAGWPGGHGLDWFVQRSSTWLGLSQCRDLLGEEESQGPKAPRQGSSHTLRVSPIGDLARTELSVLY